MNGWKNTGSKFEREGLRTILTARSGTLCARPEGASTHFENKFTDADYILNTIRAEYQVEIVDENDPRFWVYSTWEEVYGIK